MGTPAEEVKKTIENQTPEEIAEGVAKAKAEAQAKADEEATRIKEEAITKKREELETEGKTPEEIEEALKDLDGEKDELEIVREGTRPGKTQQQVNSIVTRRVKKLNTKIDDLNEDNKQSNTALSISEEKNKLLTLALDQARGNKADVLKAPDVNDFDDGTNDPEYIKKLDTYNQSIMSLRVADEVAKATKTISNTTNAAQQSEALLSKQVKHYERAEEIGAKDYEATEDKAIEILGTEYVKQIIDNFEDAHIILYFLGKNHDEAFQIANLLKSAPIMGVAEIGRLSSELKLQSKTKPTPDPDEELKGDGSPDLSANDRKLEQLRDQAAKTGDMKPLMAFKRKIAKE